MSYDLAGKMECDRRDKASTKARALAESADGLKGNAAREIILSLLCNSTNDENEKYVQKEL